MLRLARALPLALTATLVLACGDDGDNGPEGSLGAEDAGSDAARCSSTQALVNNDKLDLLFVIDNSGSMAQEQAKLAQQIPALLTSLTTGQAADGTIFTPIQDLHVGVVTTDMGLSGSKITLPPSCEGYGDDGILIKSQPDCDANASAGYLSYLPALGGLDQTLTNLSCLAAVGTTGCGFEQQLEAMYKALAPSSDTSFAHGRPGNADGSNQGFLRPDAALAVVHLTDEEDCSITEEGEALFDDNTNHPAVKAPGTPFNLGLNIRCGFGDPTLRVSQVEQAGLIQPPARYVEEFKRSVKPFYPEGIVFIAIVGIPDGSEGKTPREILEDPAMGFAVDPNTGDGDITNRNTVARDVCRQCVASSADCQVEPYGYNTNIVTAAKPGVRFVKVAEGFGENGLVQSICAESYAPALNGLVQKVAKLAKGSSTPPAGGCTP